MAELQVNVALKGTAFMRNWSVYIIPKLPHAILLLLTNKCAIFCICWLIKDESIKKCTIHTISRCHMKIPLEDFNATLGREGCFHTNLTD
jgi:hypothetical protein